MLAELQDSKVRDKFWAEIDAQKRRAPAAAFLRQFLGDPSLEILTADTGAQPPQVDEHITQFLADVEMALMQHLQAAGESLDDKANVTADAVAASMEINHIDPRLLPQGTKPLQVALLQRMAEQFVRSLDDTGLPHETRLRLLNAKLCGLRAGLTQPAYIQAARVRGKALGVAPQQILDDDIRRLREVIQGVSI